MGRLDEAQLIEKYLRPGVLFVRTQKGRKVLLEFKDADSAKVVAFALPVS